MGLGVSDMCGASFEISSTAERYWKRTCWIFSLYHSRKCHKRVTHCLSYIFSLCCVWSSFSCVGRWHVWLPKPHFVCCSWNTSSCKGKAIAKCLFPLPFHWTHLDLGQKAGKLTMKFHWLCALPHMVYNTLVPMGHSSSLMRTEHFHHLITSVTVCLLSFFFFFFKRAYLCHFKHKHPLFNISNCILLCWEDSWCYFWGKKKKKRINFRTFSGPFTVCGKHQNCHDCTVDFTDHIIFSIYFYKGTKVTELYGMKPKRISVLVLSPNFI